MESISLTAEQTKLLRLCLRNAEPLKPNFQKVTEEGGFANVSAASQRWKRLCKVLLGDEKPSPAKSNGKSAEGTAKQGAAKTTSATAKACKTSTEDTDDEGDRKTITQFAKQTPKKRERDVTMDSDMEDNTPSKILKTEFKKEDDD